MQSRKMEMFTFGAMLGLTSKFCHHIKSFQFDFEDQAKPSWVSAVASSYDLLATQFPPPYLGSDTPIYVSNSN